MVRYVYYFLYPTKAPRSKSCRDLDETSQFCPVPPHHTSGKIQTDLIFIIFDQGQFTNNMNQQLLETIYLEYQPNHYFTQYLLNNKIRPDSRTPSDHRSIRISISNGGCSVTVSRGSTIVLAQVKTEVGKVVYSAVSSSYGKQLINIVVNSITNPNTRTSKHQRNINKSIENYIDQFINWRELEKQLVYCSGQKQLYGHTGELVVRVVDGDGCVAETVLLAVQVLLWTAQFVKIQEFLEEKKKAKGNNQETNVKLGKFMLNPKSFHFPIKYIEILSQLLCDPTDIEQKNSNYELTIITDLKSQTLTTAHILKVHKNSKISPELIQSIEKLHNTILSKLSFDIEQVRKRCLGGNGSDRVVVNIVGL